MKKKAKDEDELDENDEGEETEEGSDDATDAALSSDKTSAGDKTGETDIGDLDDIADESVAGKTKSFVDKIKSKLMPKKKGEAAEEADEADEDGTEVSDKKKPAKKKINPVILVVVVVALGALFLIEDDAEQTPETAATSFKKPDRKKKVKPEEGAPATETPATETPATETPATETPTEETPSTETPTEETPVVEAPTEETPTTEEPSETPPVSVDTVDGQAPDVTDDASLTDKILEDLEKQAKKDQPKEVKKEYVAPPDFEYRGRGLVYNCTGKHWACVDAPSYKTCEDNHSSTTYLKKKVECYPFNVYETVKGCESMQNRVVSSNAKTGFCNGN